MTGTIKVPLFIADNLSAVHTIALRPRIYAGIYQPLYYYRDNNQNEIDLVFVRDGNLHCVELKAGTTFKDNADKSFKQLNETAYIRGRNAIVCTADKLSAMKSGTLIVPVTSV